MKYSDNMDELSSLAVDMMGLIFYPPSPRYVMEQEGDLLKSPKKLNRVGVFVNEEIETVLHTADRFDLDWVQLHGNESSQYCIKIRKAVPVIKAFSISNRDDFEQTKVYEGCCDLFLFDTKTPYHGGSGQKFDWSLLDSYIGNTPFLLSGGIAADDAPVIKRIKHPLLYGVDLNSRFETQPGIKDINLLKQFIKELQS